MAVVAVNAGGMVKLGQSHVPEVPKLPLMGSE